VSEGSQLPPGSICDIIVLIVISRTPARKKPGPPATGKGTPILVRLQPDLLKALDSWAEPNHISRPEAIRRLVELGLKSKK